MRAITVVPETAGAVELEELPSPAPTADRLLVQALAMGVCGTDREIIDGQYGEPPPGEKRLILGHESLGRVIDAPPGGRFTPGDLVVGIVRRPDPVPCANCAHGEWDMCQNGRYTESGIKGRHGYGAERYLLEPEFAVRIDPSLGRLGVLLEPASVLAKAWEQIERIGNRALWTPRRVLITGAGPVGLLAAMMAVERRLETHVLDRVTEGPKPQLVRDLGAEYHTSRAAEACPRPDIVLECTGAAQLVFDVIENNAPNGIVCLTGLSSGGRMTKIDLALLNRELVLENDVVFGSVNANRRHYQLAAESLLRADRRWLERLITRRVPLDRWREAFEHQEGDVKTVIEFE